MGITISDFWLSRAKESIESVGDVVAIATFCSRKGAENYGRLSGDPHNDVGLASGTEVTPHPAGILNQAPFAGMMNGAILMKPAFIITFS